MLWLMGCESVSTTDEQNQLVYSDSTGTWTPVNLQYAQGFSLEYQSTYKRLSLYSANDTIQYLLLPRDATPPSESECDQIIRIPVQRVVTQSTTHLALIRFIDAQESVVGVDNAAYVYDTIFSNATASDAILEVGSGATLNAERVIALQPDLLLVSSMPGSSLDAYQKFINLGIPVLLVAEWMESTPLGKAEWVMLMAALFNEESLATQRFENTVQSYDSLVSLAKQAQGKPSVIVGAPFQGTWYVPGATSYRTALLRDAGADWPWSQDSTAVSFPVDFERMYEYGLTADFWLDPGQVFTQQELLGIDERFADFKAIQQNTVFNSNRRLNSAQSGNDYYESGVIYPDRILADLIKILHPDLLPDHELYYYQSIQ